MFKRLRYWKTYRAIDRAVKNNSWKTALMLAKQINDAELIEIFSLYFMRSYYDE